MTPPNFADLGVSAPVRRALARRDITSPFPVQEMVLPIAMEAADLLVRAPTGSGKTLAFGIPAIERLTPGGGIRALVLAPTRELVGQIEAELAPLAAARGLSVASCHGGVDPRRQTRRARAADLLVATPGRLIDLTGTGALTLAGVELLVLDEADRMLDMGFLPQVSAIIAQLPTARTTMLFSATLDGAVGRLAADITDAPVRLSLEDRAGDVAPLSERLLHEFHACTTDGRIEALQGVLGGYPERTLVFCRTKHGADRLARRLAREGLEAGAIHGDLRQNARDRALRRFADGGMDVLVATDVASRGIDVNGVELVVNFDPPEDAAAYTHRTGRTARAGRTGRAVTLVTPDQAAQVRLIAVELGVDADGTVAGYPAPPPRPVAVPGRRPRHAVRAPRSNTPPGGGAPSPGAAGGANRVRRGSRRTASPSA